MDSGPVDSSQPEMRKSVAALASVQIRPRAHLHAAADVWERPCTTEHRRRLPLTIRGSMNGPWAINGAYALPTRTLALASRSRATLSREPAANLTVRNPPGSLDGFPPGRRSPFDVSVPARKSGTRPRDNASLAAMRLGGRKRNLYENVSSAMECCVGWIILLIR